MSDQPAQMGHNNPPLAAALLPSEEQITESLRAEHADLFKRANDIKTAADDPERLVPEIDISLPEEKREEVAAKITTFAKQCQKCRSDLAGTQTEARRPFNAVLAHVSTVFTPYLGAVTNAEQKARSTLSKYFTWKDAEAKRIADEEAAKAREAARLAEQKAQEDNTIEAAAAAEQAREKLSKAKKATEASVADRTRTRGNIGSVASARKEWVIGQIDFDKVRKTLGKAPSKKEVEEHGKQPWLGDLFTEAEIQRAMKAYAKNFKVGEGEPKPIYPGVEFIAVTGVNIR